MSSSKIVFFSFIYQLQLHEAKEILGEKVKELGKLKAVVEELME